MEFRWLTTEEQRTRAVECASLSNVLALAQKLQAEDEGWVNEEQVVEMGRELGVQPQFVREALRLRRRAAQPARALRAAPAVATSDPNPLATAARTLATVCGLMLLPLVSQSLHESNTGPGWVIATLVAAAITGWSVRVSRLAGIAGALAAPAVLLLASFYTTYGSGDTLSRHAILFYLLSLCPLGATAGRAAAAVRRWAERLADRERLAVPGH
jgi:hypothetical protein